MDFEHGAEIRIQKAEDADLHDIVRAWKRNIKTANTLSDIADIFYSFKRYFFIVTSAGGVIGFVGGAIRGGHGHISGIAVDKEYRMKGIGTSLLKMLEDEFRNDAFDTVTLEVRKSDRVAIQVYEKHGYKPTYTVKGYYADGEDAVVYKKRI